jgi:hypothetical protein
MKGPPSQSDKNDDDMTMSPPASTSEHTLMEASKAPSIERNEPTYSEIAASLVPSLDTVNPTVPEIYQEVLYHLRRANDSGLWPSTTPKRQLVMISSLTEQQPASITATVIIIITPRPCVWQSKRPSRTRTRGYRHMRSLKGKVELVEAFPWEPCQKIMRNPRPINFFPNLPRQHLNSRHFYARVENRAVLLLLTAMHSSDRKWDSSTCVW